MRGSGGDAWRRFTIAISVCLAIGRGAFAQGDFSFPTLKSQPAVIREVVRSGKQDAIVIVSRSSRPIRGIRLIFAGSACTPHYKPGWPTVSRDNLNIAPGESASVSVPASPVDGVAARSLASCGHAVATEVAVTDVRFADGSTWSLGDQVKSGEKREAD
jgi:hypothetical protein